MIERVPAPAEQEKSIFKELLKNPALRRVVNFALIAGALALPPREADAHPPEGERVEVVDTTSADRDAAKAYFIQYAKEIIAQDVERVWESDLDHAAELEIMIKDMEAALARVRENPDHLSREKVASIGRGLEYMIQGFKVMRENLPVAAETVARTIDSYLRQHKEAKSEMAHGLEFYNGMMSNAGRPQVAGIEALRGMDSSELQTVQSTAKDLSSMMSQVAPYAAEPLKNLADHIEQILQELPSEK